MVNQSRSSPGKVPDFCTEFRTSNKSGGGRYNVVRNTTAVPFLDATKLRWQSAGAINKSPKRNSCLVPKQTVPQITWKIENFGSAFAGRG